MTVIYPGDDGELTKSAATDLLPSKYVPELPGRSP